MVMSVFRVLVGFALACLATALVQLAFASPNDVFSGETDKLDWTVDHVLLAATHSAVFSAPFALVAAAIGEWQSIRSWVYYALSGIAIAIAGFIALYLAEASTADSIVNNYALAAYLCAGIAGGVVYWLVSGRSAGDPAEYEAQTRAAVRSTPASTSRR